MLLVAVRLEMLQQSLIADVIESVTLHQINDRLMVESALPGGFYLAIILNFCVIPGGHRMSSPSFFAWYRESQSVFSRDPWWQYHPAWVGGTPVMLIGRSQRFGADDTALLAPPTSKMAMDRTERIQRRCFHLCVCLQIGHKVPK